MRPLDSLLVLLPRGARRALATAAGEIVRWIDPAGRRRARAAVALARPDLSGARQRGLVRRAYRRRPLLALESRIARRRGPEAFCRDVTLEGWHQLDRAEAAGGGLVVLETPFGAAGVARRALEIYRGDTRLLHLRPADDGPPGAGLLGCRVQLTGAEALAAVAAGAPVVPVFGLPDRDGFVVAAREPVTGGGSMDAVAAALAERLEAEIQARPDLWPWMDPDWSRE